MRRIDFVNHIKPLLRATGIAFVVMFLLGLEYHKLPLPLFRDPAKSLNFISEFLERSTLLSVALLCLALSLADRSRPQLSPVQPTIGLRDRVLMGARFLVGLTAIVYLLLIPYLLLESQALYNLSVRANEQRSIKLNQSIDEMLSDIDAGRIKASDLPQLIKINPWIQENNRYKVNNLNDLRSRIQAARGEVKESFRRIVQEWRTTTQRISIRSSLMSLFQAVLIGYFWFHWPHNPRRPSRKVHEFEVLTGTTEEPIN